jgi:hypothetical protein
MKSSPGVGPENIWSYIPSSSFLRVVRLSLAVFKISFCRTQVRPRVTQSHCFAIPHWKLLEYLPGSSHAESSLPALPLRRRHIPCSCCIRFTFSQMTYPNIRSLLLFRHLRIMSLTLSYQLLGPLSPRRVLDADGLLALFLRRFRQLCEFIV